MIDLQNEQVVLLPIKREKAQYTTNLTMEVKNG